MWLWYLETPLERRIVSEFRMPPHWTSWREPWTGLREHSPGKLFIGNKLWLLLLPLRQVVTPGLQEWSLSRELCKLQT